MALRPFASGPSPCRCPEARGRCVGVAVAAALLAFPFVAPSTSAQVPAAGFAGTGSNSIAAPGAFVGGLEVLPDGNLAVFDGTSVVELAFADGSFVTTLFTPPGSVFGAFLRRGPDPTKLYFGESSQGNVWEIELATGLGTIVVDTLFPYDLAFDSQGRPFLSYSTNFFGPSHVALADFATGALDDVVDLAEPSGPITFDRDGNLLMAVTDISIFPPPPGAATVLRFAQADVELKIGPGALADGDGAILGQLDGASNLLLDEAGDLLVTDPNGGRVVQLTPADGRQVVVAQADAGQFLGYLAFVPGTRGAYEPWQPAEAGTLLVTESDFFSTNTVAGLTPARPALATTPASPIPVGPFTSDVAGSVPSGFGLLFVAPAGSAPGETELRNRHWPAPLFFGLDLSAGLVVVPVAFDGDGVFHAAGSNPGLGHVTIGLQLLCGATLAGPFFGTSAPVDVEFD